MIIQNGSRASQEAQALGRSSEDVQKLVAAGPAVESKRAPAVELPQADAVVDAQQASAAQVAKAVEDINRAMRQSNRNLQFSVDAEANRVIVRLTDAETGELIRQIPSDETLAISRAIGDFQQGLLLRQKA